MTKRLYFLHLQTSKKKQRLRSFETHLLKVGISQSSMVPRLVASFSVLLRYSLTCSAGEYESES